MTNPDSVLKSRDITLPTKICIPKAKVFPVVTYGCESWTVKKAECWRIDACGAREDFWKSLRQQGDQTSQSSGRSTLIIHWKVWGWSWRSSIFIIWCKQMTHWKSPWCWERLRTGEEGVRGWDGWMASLGDMEVQGSLACCSPWSRKELEKTGQLNNKRKFNSRWIIPHQPKKTEKQRQRNY